MTWDEPQGSPMGGPDMEDTVSGAGFNMLSATVTMAGVAVAVIAVILDMIYTSQFDSQNDATFGKTVVIVRMAGFAIFGFGLVWAGMSGRNASGGVRAALIGIGAFILMGATGGLAQALTAFSGIFRGFPGL